VDEEESAEDEDDFNKAEDLYEEEEEEGEIITNSPKQLSNCSFEPVSKFKNVSSILVDGYSLVTDATSLTRKIPLLGTGKKKIFS
jgi:hypothetical protein